jgi:hypothetical protein
MQLLEPVLDDPSHDVRVAACCRAWPRPTPRSSSPISWHDAHLGAERTAMRRVVVTAAIVMLARTDAGKTAAEAALTKRRPREGRRWRGWSARLALGLIEGRADGHRVRAAARAVGLTPRSG